MRKRWDDGPRADGALTFCATSASRVSVNNNPYSSEHRYRAEFDVNFPLPDSNATFMGAVATVTLDNSWLSQPMAAQDVARYPVGNRTACFCPVVALVLAAVLMGIPSIVWHRTKCFRRSMRPCRGSHYDLVN